MSELQTTYERPVTVTLTQQPSWPDSHTLGEKGERRAAEYLERRGWEILGRNWRCDFGEVDIIARDNERDESPTVLVEVKTRAGRGREWPFPEEAVDERKRQRYWNMAQRYLQEHPNLPSVRMDVIAVVDEGTGQAHLRHYVNPFRDFL